jgi:hypothetical protein
LAYAQAPERDAFPGVNPRPKGRNSIGSALSWTQRPSRGRKTSWQAITKPAVGHFSLSSWVASCSLSSLLPISCTGTRARRPSPSRRRLRPRLRRPHRNPLLHQRPHQPRRLHQKQHRRHHHRLRLPHRKLLHRRLRRKPLLRHRKPRRQKHRGLRRLLQSSRSRQRFRETADLGGPIWTAQILAPVTSERLARVVCRCSAALRGGAQKRRAPARGLPRLVRITQNALPPRQNTTGRL